MISVVLLSGGMDSTLTAAIAKRESQSVAALHLNYRHRTEQRELQAFQDVADALDIKQRLVVDIEFLRAIGGSSLTDSSMDVTAPNLHATAIPTSYVPFRNGNFLAIAASWAEVLGAGRIYIGAVEEDSSGYPDCRSVFFEAFQRVLDLGTRPETKLEIRTPVITMKKSEIVLRSMELQTPLEKTWSCYKSDDVSCGECDSCALRLRGFSEASIADPIPYRVRPVYD